MHKNEPNFMDLLNSLDEILSIEDSRDEILLEKSFSGSFGHHLVKDRPRMRTI